MENEQINQLLKRKKNLERIRDLESKLRNSDSLQASKERLIYTIKEVYKVDIELNQLDPSRFKISEELNDRITTSSYVDGLLKNDFLNGLEEGKGLMIFSDLYIVTSIELCFKKRVFDIDLIRDNVRYNIIQYTDQKDKDVIYFKTYRYSEITEISNQNIKKEESNFIGKPIEFLK